ncbi:orotate phosphoribosyltransferase [Omnitrophica bacterium]|nr:orotate phosphoribosyltransferase [Candidatus Omnitrophota bacterium]
MTQAEALRIFQDTGALQKGHFKLSSGLHSGQYMQCALALQHPEHAERLSRELASKFKNDGVSVVIGPALGGVIVSYEIARALGVRSIFAEREDGKMTLRRGFAIDKKDKVLVVEDVVTTGASTKEVLDIVKKSGASIVGVGALVDRSRDVNFEERFISLLNIDISTFKPEDCPLCKEKMPLVKPGSRDLRLKTQG